MSTEDPQVQTTMDNLATTDITVNVEVPEVPVVFTEVGLKGEKGDTGAQGTQGVQGVQGQQGVPGTVGPFREGHTFAVLGDLGTVTDLPPFFVPKMTNQTVKLAGVITKLKSGTVNLQVKKSGLAMGGVIAVTSTPTWTSLGSALVGDGEEISATLSSPASAVMLSATVVLEWSVP